MPRTLVPAIVLAAIALAGALASRPASSLPRSPSPTRAKLSTRTPPARPKSIAPSPRPSPSAVPPPTPSPTLSPLPSAQINYYARLGARASGLDVSLVRSVIDAESAGDPRAVSSAGAVGLMQIEPSTAGDCGVSDRYDARANVRCGARTLAYLIRDFGLRSALAAYNWGSGNVAAHPRAVDWPAETRQYVDTVLQRYDMLQHVSLMYERPPLKSKVTSPLIPVFRALS